MGILNVTPDSFFDGGRYADPESAVSRALEMEEDGADFIDIGGESSRPGADPVPVEEELRRVIPVIEELSGRLTVPVSIDTVKPAVARRALAAGAAMINDISGLNADVELAEIAAAAGVPIILMHMAGTPKMMQDEPMEGDVLEGIVSGLRTSVSRAISAGVPGDSIIVDPGIGFGKKRPDNFKIIKELRRICDLGFPVLAGVSRKSFIGWALDLPEDERLHGTIAANTACILNGADIIRVHDVRAAKEAAVIADLILRA
ncbi:dihydropteroate synthase [bacterium]|nr:dihydropteroate synthase [bacterium]